MENGVSMPHLKEYRPLKTSSLILGSAKFINKVSISPELNSNLL
jgi:hypothetical protein